MNFFSILLSFFTPEALAAALRIATPITLAALAATLCERSGVINIGIEGIMLLGAFAAVAGTYASGSPIIGLAAAVVVGGLSGLVMAFSAITLKANQIVLGAALNIFASGLSGFLTTVIFNSPGASAGVSGFEPLSIPFLSEIPWLGPILFSQTPLVYSALMLALFGHVFLFHTPWGAWVRAAGDRPFALHTAGVSVIRVRYWAVIFSGCIAGLAGAHLTLEITRHFTVNMTAGRGFIGLAANIFGKWTPLGSLGASLLFGFANSIELRSSDLRIPPELLLMLPFILTLVVLIGVMGRASAPNSLGQSYDVE